MLYQDIDYINELYYFIFELLQKVRARKHLDEQSINEMISLTIQLLELLELNLDDKYEY